MTAAIVLAGGRASRLGGAAKPLLEVGGRTLLDHAVAAVADCDPVIVVGPRMPVAGNIAWVRENPPFGGPVAAIAAGLAHLGSTALETAEVYVLAADLPNADEAVALLRRHPLSPSEDGVCLSDASGRMQWLTGRYRVDALRAAAQALPDEGRDASARALLGGLTLTAVDAGGLAADIDTWDDLERARAKTQGHRRDDAPEETT
ncbi:molybdenum cofactor guanylyltransferase [Microbacterium sp. UFMG61]|uniref:molybdenum cofactor guanylyltransferase n=1 Tax=Microbacterium sp. UFMG61 TaxID=2745935 RepID=UPI00188ECA34|nr:molybdenum cofactor guanylyltransferase [Microbacterium sp. UFMG61]